MVERSYRIREVDASLKDVAKQIRRFNNREEQRFPKLSDGELTGKDCFWWMAYDSSGEPAGFAGVVPSQLYPNSGYLKRCYVAPSARGHSLQRRFLRVREWKSRKVGWDMLVTECTNTVFSATNLFRAGYELFDPEKRWAFEESLYWRKFL